MYQRIAREYQPQKPERQAPHPDHYVANAIGKATLAQQQSPQRYLGPADLRLQAIETAQREVMAIRVVLLPALIKALRSKEPAHVKQREAANAATQIRYMLTSANERLLPLEKAATYRDPLLQFLRREIDTLAARSRRLGVYEGREHLIPHRHEEEPIKHSPTKAHRTLGPADHKHDPTPNPFAGLQPLSALRRRRTARGTSPTRIRLQPRHGAPK